MVGSGRGRPGVDDDDLVAIAAELGQRDGCGSGAIVVTAESCTGGLLARALTETAGSSDWFERGFVTYSNEAKVDLLGVRLGHPAGPRRGQRSGRLGDGGRRAQAFAGGTVAGRHRHCRARAAAVAGKPVGTVCFGWGLALAGQRTARPWSSASSGISTATGPPSGASRRRMRCCRRHGCCASACRISRRWHEGAGLRAGARRAHSRRLDRMAGCIYSTSVE